MTSDTGPRPRVLHVITHLDMGGAENVALALIDALRDRADFALFAVLEDPTPGAVGRDMAARLAGWGVPVRYGTRRGFKSGGVLLAAHALARAIAEQQADVVHVHTEIPELTMAVCTLLSRQARRVPLLRTIHNTELWIDWHRIGRWVTQRLSGAQTVAVSAAAARADAAIATRHARPVAEVIHNGVAPPPRATAPREPGPHRILFAGRLVHQKGADLLPAILRAAHAQAVTQEVSVLIAGSGELRESVETALADGLPGWNVRIVDPIARLSEQLHRFDAVLLPSRFEGFALLPLEVLMAGVPLVTTDAPGLDELLPGDYPFRARVDDVAAIGAVLAQVIDEPDGAHTVATCHGDAIAQRFGLAGMASAYLARYRMLADGGRRA